MRFEDTIAAIATAPGNGAIALIRISGKNTFKIIEKLFFPKKSPLIFKPYTLSYGFIKENDHIIDEVLLSIFKAPHSYTGEDSAEISCHGSVYIQQKILRLFISSGARLANPGEFTQRAFLNGKMDLSQAEAVADLIASKTAAAHKVAMQQMRGGFSNEISKLRNQLLHFISLLELELDFSEEDVEFADRKQLENLIREIETVIRQLLDSFRLGNAIKNGIPVTIVGNTNTGKSTLLNALLKEDKAIVSDIEGTTRDVIEDTINLGGFTFRFIDTAGIRKTQDRIENLGIERTFSKMKQAEVLILMLNAEQSIQSLNASMAEISRSINRNTQQLIVCVNKIDLVKNTADIIQNLQNNILPQDKLVCIAAKHGKNIDKLIDVLLQEVHKREISEQDVIVTNVRHYEALKNAQDSILRVQEGLQNDIDTVFLAQDIRESLHFLGEITGNISTDEVLGNIFKNFCIGK